MRVRNEYHTLTHSLDMSGWKMSNGMIWPFSVVMNERVGRSAFLMAPPTDRGAEGVTLARWAAGLEMLKIRAKEVWA